MSIAMRRPPRDAARPDGFTVTELIVAATLLVAVLSITTQLTVRTDRVRQAARREQLALNELENQLDRLTSADNEQRSKLLAALAPTAPVADVLPEARLRGAEISDDQGQRITLTLSWKQGAVERPVTLVGWIDPWPEAPEERDAPDESDELDESDEPDESAVPEAPKEPDEATRPEESS